jgi:O-antigen/teichoic acid export membrane protein
LKINKKQFQTKNFKGVVSLLAGNTISKTILTIGGLVLAKFYGPESYGVYSVFLSYIVILPALSNLQLDNVLMLQKGSKDVRNIFSGTVIIISILTSLIVSIVCFLKIFNLIKLDLPLFVIILCGIGGILTGWNLSQNALFTKYKLFKHISFALILASVVSIVFQTIFFLFNFTENGLIYGWIVGLAASFLYNLNVSKERWQKVDFKKFRENVSQHINIVKYSYTSVTINTIANNILPILVISYFGKLEVGVYAMAMKVLSTPLVLMASSITKVYFQKSVTLFHHDRKGLQNLTLRVSAMSFIVILIFVLLVNTIGIYILEMIFSGNEWIGLRKYLLVLSIWILARSAINPIASIVVVINKNQYSLIFNVYLLIVNLIAIYVGVYYQNFEYCLYIFSIFSSLGYFIQLIAVFIDLKKLAKHEA